MKYILILAVLTLGSCNESKEDKMHRLLNAYYDSAQVYFHKWECCFSNKEFEKADSFSRIREFYRDSGSYYYNLLYPPTPIEPPKPKPPCDCK